MGLLKRLQQAHKSAKAAAKLADAIDKFLLARTSKEENEIVAKYPELLSEEADAQLAHLATAARTAGRVAMAGAIERKRRSLNEAGGSEADNKDNTVITVAQLRTFLAEVHGATDPQDLRRYIERLERMRDNLPAEADFRLRAVIHDALAMFLDRLATSPEDDPTADRRAYVERAIENLKMAATFLPREEEPRAWARIKHRLGDAYRSRIKGERAGNLEEAVSHLEAAREVLAEEGAWDDWASVSISLGAAYADLGGGDRSAIGRAWKCFEDALSVTSQKESPDRWARIQNNLGLLSREVGLGDAVASIERAISHHKAALAASRLGSFDRAQFKLNLGRAYVDMATTKVVLATASLDRGDDDLNGDLDKAVDCFESASVVLTRQRAPIEWAMTQDGLGRAYHAYSKVRSGEREKYVGLATRCLDAALQVFDLRHFPAESASSARALGAVCSEAQRWDDAARAFLTALEAAESLYGAALLRQAREAELAEVSHLHANAAYAVARTGDLPLAVAILEQGRARGLGEMLWQASLNLYDLKPEDAAAYEQAVRRLRAIEASEWSRTITPAVDEQTRTLRKELREEIAGARRDLAEIEERLLRQGVDVRRSQLPFDEIADQAVPGVPLAYATVTPHGGSLILLVDRPAHDSAVNVTEVSGAEPLTAEQLAKLLVKSDGETVVGGYLPAQTGFWPPEPPEHLRERLEEALAELLPALGRLTGPLAAELLKRRAHGVVLVPCGLLALLPLHVYERETQTRTLLDELDVTYAPSARVLSAARRTSGQRVQASSSFVLAGVGGPEPDPKPLVFAQAEIQAVAGYFVDPHPLPGKEATKPNLIAAARRATHVHLACHAVFEPNDPLESYLELAGKTEPGLLTLRDLLAERWFATARLVVASACQTAMTDFTRLPDEAIGFPGGFIHAGAPGVVGTLWLVNDLSTALLMVRFYRWYLYGDPQRSEGPVPPARALRRAQLWLAQATCRELLDECDMHEPLRSALEGSARARLWRMLPTIRPFASPYYWAPFVFVGA